MEFSDILLPFPLGFTPGAAIFDCDGTVANTMPLHYQAWREALDPLNCPFPENLFYAWGGVTTPEILRRLSERYSVTLDIEQVAHDKEAAYQKFIPSVTPIRAVLAEVERFYPLCPLALASGGERDNIHRVLTALEINHYFGAIVTANDVTHGKPAPDTFLLAAEKLGVAPEQCVVYEDSPTGFEAARRAGMKAIDVRPYAGHPIATH